MAQRHDLAGGVSETVSPADRWVAGRFWVAQAALLALLAVLAFTCAPAVLVDPHVELPPAYALKAQHPFADTSTLTVPEHAGERSHGAKLTPRLAGALLLHVAYRAGWHPYVPATVFGLCFLVSGIVVGSRLSGDRWTGLGLGLTYAGLYAASACFAINWMPKPFDGVAIGCVGLVLMALEWPWLLAVTAFASCWTDERAIVALVFVGCVALAYPGLGRRERWSRCLVIAGAVAAYGLVRAVLSQALGWGSDSAMVGFARQRLLLLPLAGWICFEGGWVAIGLALWLGWRRGNRLACAAFAGLVAAAVLSCLFVLDVSRVASFAFPLIPAAYALLRRAGASRAEFRLVAGAGAAISLLAPNLEVIAGVAVKWLSPLLFRMLALP